MFNNLVGILALVCAVWVIYEVWIINKSKTVVGKIIWTVAAVFFSIATAIVYYFLEKKK